VVKVLLRDAVQKRLAEAGITTGIHYPFPIHTMRGYEFLGVPSGALPVTEALAGRILSLPLFPELSDAAVDAVCDAMNAIVAGV